jgi:hypothetical protein
MEGGTVGVFKRRLLVMNSYLQFFPPPRDRTATSALGETEFVEILDRAKPAEFQMDVLSSNDDPHSKALQEYAEYLEQLETKLAIANHLKKNGNDQAKQPSNQNKKKKARI